MALVRDGLWEIVAGTETAPAATETAEVRSKFQARRDCALAMIVLAIDPALLYLIGDPIAAWMTLQNLFQKKTWANKLVLCHKLRSLQMKDRELVQEHIKAMTELFNELAIVGDAIDDEDCVVYLLASLPDSFNALVTALEANEDVPKMEVVTERLLHAERKQKEKTSADLSDEKVMTTRFRGRGPRCYHCWRFGHIQRNCPECTSAEQNVCSSIHMQLLSHRRSQKVFKNL